MKLTLMIEASPAVIGAIAAVLESHPGGADAAFTVQPTIAAPLPVPTPLAPAVVAPVTGITLPQDADDDENGAADANAPAVDAKGLPWDARIHAKTKATVADGTWRARRGVDAATVVVVEAELRGRMGVAPPAPPIAAPAAPVAIPMPAAPIAPTPVAPQPVAAPVAPPVAVASPMAAPAPAAMPAPAPIAAVPMPAVEAPAPVAAASPAALDGNSFMAHLASKMGPDPATGVPTIDQDYLIALVAEINAATNAGMTAISDISKHPQLLEYAASLLQRDGRW